MAILHKLAKISTTASLEVCSGHSMNFFLKSLVVKELMLLLIPVVIHGLSFARFQDNLTKGNDLL